MHAVPQAATLDRSLPRLAERASAILRDEMANGALANIAGGSQGWSAHRRRLMTPSLTSGLESELLGLRDALLDLVAPPQRPPAAPLSRPSAGPGQVVERSQQETVPLPVLRAVRGVPPGGVAAIHTGLRNDGSAPVLMDFVWSDLVADRGGRIHAGRMRLSPARVRVPAGSLADLAIGLDVPNDAPPGLYRTFLEATEPLGVRALLAFPVGFDL